MDARTSAAYASRARVDSAAHRHHQPHHHQQSASGSNAAFPWPFVPPPSSGHSHFHALLGRLASSARSSPSSSSSSGVLTLCDRLDPVSGLFDMLPPSRVASLRAAHARLQRAEREHLAARLLEREVTRGIQQLQQPGASDDTADDLALYAHLLHAREFLQMDGGDEEDEHRQARVDKDAPPAPPATLFGLDWTSLSGAFKPRSSAIPSASADSSARSAVSSHAQAAQQGHSFTHPSASSLQTNFHSILMPVVESGLSERLDALWNEFDPHGEERTLAEEEAAHPEARTTDDADAASYMQSPPQPLPPLDSSDLHSLLVHRSAALRRVEADLARATSAASQCATAYRATLVSSLRHSASVLARRHVLTASNETRAQLEWLRAKLSVISSKLAKTEAQVRQDTYLPPPPPASHHHHGAQPAPPAVLSSLSVIHSTLQAQRAHASQALTTKQRQVAEYQAMGGAFDALAQELAAIRRKTEYQKWTLQELHTHGGGSAQQPQSRGNPRRF